MTEPHQAPPEDFEFAALSEARNYRDALLREFAAHLRGRVLEVGAGVGQITGGCCKIEPSRSSFLSSRIRHFSTACAPVSPATPCFRARLTI